MAKKLRVYELAKHYGVDSAAIMALLRTFRAEAKSHMSIVEDDVVDKIHARFQRQREVARLNYARDHKLDPEKLKHVASLRELPRPQPAPEKPREKKPAKKAPAKKATAKSKVVVIKKAGTATAVVKAKEKARQKAEAAAETAAKAGAAKEEARPVRKLVRKASAPAAGPVEATPAAPPAEAPTPAPETAPPPSAESPEAPPSPPAETGAGPAPAEETAAPTTPPAAESAAPAGEPEAAGPAEAKPAAPSAPPAPPAPPPRRGAKIIRLGGPVGGPRAAAARGPLPPADYSDLLPQVPEPEGGEAPGLKAGVKDSVKESVKAALRRRRDEKAAADAEAELRRKRSRHRRKKVDEVEVAKNVKQTLAQLDSGPGHRRHARRSGPAAVTEEDGSILRVTEFITVQELAEKLEVQPRDVIAKLFALGVMATINQRLDKDTIELVAAEFERTIEFLGEYGEEVLEEEEIPAEDMVKRPPVVTVMGHVDHGKTSLLDYLRHTNVIAGEAGGITQHIGAYTIDTPGGPITFLDTPGHQAFSAMRARGAQVTDIVILVVAADDRVMPQTIEAINHAKAAGVPLIVAINKIDLPGARPDLVKQELTQHGIVVEEFGGQNLAAEISAKKGTNVDKLLELVHLQAEVLELTASPKGAARGTVVEAAKEPGRGVVFTVLIEKGTLKVGDNFLVGLQDGKVRALFNERNEPLEEVHPGEPAVVTGAADVPEAGDRFHVLESERAAREISARRRSLQRQQQLARPKRQVDLENLASLISAEDLKELPIIVKGDVAGSVEALCDQLMQLNTAEVQIRVIHKAVGAVNESDVLLAGNTGAMIIGFHLRPGTAIRELAKSQAVTIEVFDIIYEAVDTLKKAMAGLLGTIQREVSTGSAEVRQVFRIPNLGLIAGAYVTHGVITRNSRGRVVRNEMVVFEGKISSLKRFKDDAREVQAGFECGIGVENFHDLAVGDVIETFRIEEIQRTEL